MAQLHNRMPVILDRDWRRPGWIQSHEPSEVLDILDRSAGVPLDAYPVSRMVNKPSDDGKELIRPIE